MKMTKLLSILMLALMIALMLSACAEADQTSNQGAVDTNAEGTAEGDLQGMQGSDAELDPDGDGQVTICHSTGSAANPYEEITVSVQAVAGHERHEGDVIPAPDEGCLEEGTAEPTAEPTGEPTAEPTGEGVTCETGDTIADILAEHEDDADTADVEEEFEQFAGLVEESPDVMALLDADGEYTVFAPVDMAFAITTFPALDDDEQLNDLLLNHVTNGVLTVEDLRTMTSITMLSGEEVLVSVEGDEIVLDGVARIVVEEIEACNGMIYGIDHVLLPDGLDTGDNTNTNENDNTGDNANTNENTNTNDNTNTNTNTNENDNTGNTNDNAYDNDNG